MKKKFFITMIFLLTGCSFCTNIKFRKNLTAGKMIWEKRYDWDHGLENILDIKVDEFNNVYIAGHKSSFINNYDNKLYAAIIKLKSDGKEDIRFNQTFELNQIEHYIKKIALDTNNIYAISNNSNLKEKSNKTDWEIRKIDKTGTEDKTFYKTFDFAPNTLITDYSYDLVVSITIDNENNIYIFGQRMYKIDKSGPEQSDWIIQKIITNNSQNTKNWSKIITEDHFRNTISDSISDNQNNIYIVGSSEDLVGDTHWDWWIKKFDSNGIENVKNWNKKIDGNSRFDEANTIAIDSKGNIYVAGYGTNIVSEHSNKDWWIKKFDSNGIEDTVNWNKKIDGNGGDDVINAIAVDKDDNLYVVGYGYCIVEKYSGEDWWIKKFDSNGIEDTVNWNIMIDYNNSGDIPNAIAIDNNGDIYVGGSGWQLVDKYSDEDLKILHDRTSPVELRIETALKSSREDMWLIKFSGGKK